jgi:hypothetical protein
VRFFLSAVQDENAVKMMMKEKVERKIVVGADETDGHLRVHDVHRPMFARENDQGRGHQVVRVPAHHIRILGPSPRRGHIVDLSRVPR